MRVLLLAGLCLVAPFAARADDAQAIGDIRREYLQVQKSLKTLSSFSGELPSKGSDKEKATVYFEGLRKDGTRDIRKIAYQVSGTLSLRQIDLFFRDGKLFFAYENFLKGDPGGWKEDRFYFQDGKLIHWLKGRESIEDVDPDFKHNEHRLVDLARDLSSHFRKPGE